MSSCDSAVRVYIGLPDVELMLIKVISNVVVIVRLAHKDSIVTGFGQWNKKLIPLVSFKSHCLLNTG
jgi:hypothetical protein